MRTKTQIERVPPGKGRRAAGFLVGGATQSPVHAARAERLLYLAGQEARQVFWWARRGRRPTAAAMVLRRPGRTGMLLTSRTDDAGVDAEALARVIASATHEAMSVWELSLVQAFAKPTERAQQDVLAAGGLRHLADLIHLRRGLAEPGPGTAVPWPQACRFERYDPRDTGELARTIEQTYEGTMDCPALCGLRPVRDVLASHRTSGRYRPDWWWLARWEGEPAGCVLLNAAAGTSDQAELVYLGVCPAWRGRGLGRALVDAALRALADEGVRTVRLAVDAANHVALALYREAGFVEADRSIAMARLARPRKTAGNRGFVGEM